MWLNKNSQRWYFAWENLQWGFCDVGCCFSFIHFCSHFVVVLHFVVILHSFPGYFTMPPALHPGFSDPWRPPIALSSMLASFHFLCFFIYRESYGFEWAFFTHRYFLPYTLSPTFLTAFIKAPLGAGSFSLMFAGLHSCWSSKHRPSPSVCWIHNNPQSW